MKGNSWHRWAVTNASVMLPYHAFDSLLVFLYTMLIARGLGVHSFGWFATAVAISTILYLLVDFGTSLRMVRDIASGHGIASALKSTLALRLACALVLGALALMAHHRGASLVGFILLLTAAEGLRSAQGLVQAVLLGRKRPLAVGIVGALEKSGILLFIAIWLWLRGSLTLPVTAGALLVGRLAPVTLGMILTRSSWSGGSLGPSHALRYLAASRNLGLFVFSERCLVNSLPLVVSLSVGVQATGQFQAAFKVLMVPVSFFTAFASAFYPVVAGMADSGREHLRRAISLGLSATLIAASWFGFLLLLRGDSLILLVFGEAFRPAGAVLQSLAPVALLWAVWQFCLHVLTGLHHERLVLRSSLVSTIAVPLITLVLGSAFGLHAIPLALMAGLSLAAGQYLPALLHAGLLDLRILKPLSFAGALGLSLLALLLVRLWLPGPGLVPLLTTAAAATLLLPAALTVLGVLPLRWLRIVPRYGLGAWMQG